jgi:hypothetical protein
VIDNGKIVTALAREIRDILATDDAADRIATALIEALQAQGDPNGALASLDEGEDDLYCTTRDTLTKAALYRVYLNF